MKLWVIRNEINEFEYEQFSKERFDFREMYHIEREREKEIAASFDFTNLCDYDLYERVADKMGVERILTEEEIGEALLFPPKDSRAELRVQLAAKYNNAALSWNKITINHEPKIRIDVRRPYDEEYSRLVERYPELARMPSVVVVFLGENQRENADRQVLVRMLAEQEEVRGWEEHISREIRNRIIRNPYLDYLMYSCNKTYRFDELDGWNEDRINEKIEEISRKEEAEAERRKEET
jgi:hypothetical protein